MPPPTAASKRNGASGPPGDGLELRAVVGDDVLVGGDDRLAGAERRRDQRAGRLVAAHHLDDDVVSRVGDEVGRGVGQDGRIGCRRSRARVEVADGDAGQRQRRDRRTVGAGPGAATSAVDDRAARRCRRRASPTRSGGRLIGVARDGSRASPGW